MRHALVTLLLLAAACDYDPRGRCESAGECLAGQVCSGGLCVPAPPAPVNHAPVAVSDAYPVAAAGELFCAAPCLLANDSDPDGDPLTAEPVVSRPAHGVAYVSPDGSFHYLAEAGYSGPDAFAYRASDGVLSSAEATVTLTVAAAP